MVLMEKIIRPHLPVQPDPTQQKPQCQQVPAKTTVKIVAPSMLAFAGAQQNPQPPKAPSPIERTRTSSEAHSYKLYMTKREKEVSDSAGGAQGSRNIVGSGEVTDAEAPPQPSSST